jgi:hypothetical protein
MCMSCVYNTYRYETPRFCPECNNDETTKGLDGPAVELTSYVSRKVCPLDYVYLNFAITCMGFSRCLLVTVSREPHEST